MATKAVQLRNLSPERKLKSVFRGSVMSKPCLKCLNHVGGWQCCRCILNYSHEHELKCQQGKDVECKEFRLKTNLKNE